MSDTSGEDRTPRKNQSGRQNDPNAEVTNKDVLTHLQQLGDRINSLEKKSVKMSKRIRKQRPSGKHKVSPVRLNFEDDEENSDHGPKKPTFSDVETDQENPEWGSQRKEGEVPEPSVTRSISVFDRMGNKLTNKDLRHELDKQKEKSAKKGYVEVSASKGSRGTRKEKQPSQDRRSRSTRVPTAMDGESGSSFTQSSAHHPSGSSSKATESEGCASDGEGVPTSMRTSARN